MTVAVANGGYEMKVGGVRVGEQCSQSLFGISLAVSAC